MTFDRSVSFKETDNILNGDIDQNFDSIGEGSESTTDEFKDTVESELVRLKDDVIHVVHPLETSWYLNPLHKPRNNDFDIVDLERKSPLQASVIKAERQGSLYQTPKEDVEKIPIDSFDISMFCNAAYDMMKSRSLTSLTSPYQYKLAMLKMESLKLEEDRLLQKKTLSELERIRGPSPRWYEMKSSGFHVELRKNNQYLASKGRYKEITDYRHRLLQSLKRSETP